MAHCLLNGKFLSRQACKLGSCPRTSAAYRKIACRSTLLVLVLLASCSRSRNKEVAQQAVLEFHRQVDSEQWHNIYSEADDEFRKGGSEADFTALLQAVRHKLGNIRASQMHDYKETWIADEGAFVILIYNTQFVDGKAVETFAWRMRGARAVLHGYNINSNALILK